MHSSLLIWFSTTQTVKHTHTSSPKNLGEFLLHVKKGGEFNSCDLKKQISRVRSTKDKELKSLEKLKLPSVRVGIYQQRNWRKNTSGYLTGLISYDIDHLGGLDKINRVKTILSEVLHKPVTMFVSPSGDGLKLIYWTNLKKIDSKVGEAEFKRAWKAIALYVNKTLKEHGFDICVDEAPKNPASSMYASYDPDLWVNPTPDLCMIKIEELDGYQEALKKQTSSSNRTANNESATKQRSKTIVSSLKPSLSDFNKLLEGMPTQRKERALNAIQVYLETPSGLGKRYKAFFKTISYIACLGLTKEKLLEIMKQLDYDQSRDLSAVLQSLIKYGYFENNQPLQTLQRSPVYQKHLSSLKQAKQTIPINRFVSEANDQIVKSIQDHQVTMLMSPTGTGKTSFCLKDLPKIYNQGRIFFCVPLISLREQVSAYLDHTSQILRDGEALKQYKRLVVLSYEKLASILPQIGKQDLLIIDEVHLFAQHFRSGATSKILSHIKERGTKALLLSATGHEANCVLSEVFSASFNSLSLEAKEKKVFNLNVIKTADLIQDVVASCVRVLNDNPKAKILVFKDNIEELYDLENKLKDKAISSLILTSSHKDTEAFKNIFKEAAIPEQSVILATGVVSVGVAITFIDHIIIAGKVSTASLMQLADRGRRGQDVEMFISNQRKANKELVNCFEDTYIKAYLEKAQRFVDFENTRLRLLYGDDLSPWDIEEYIKATHHTLKTSSAKHTNIPMQDILACGRKAASGALIMNVQGVLSNVISIEARNENNLDYYVSKLKTLYGIETYINESTEVKKEDKKEKACAWDILKERIGDEEVSIERVEETIKSMKIGERQRADLIDEIKRRLIFLSLWSLSSSYALLDAKAWTHFTHMVSINKNPKLHPLETALAEKVKEKGDRPLFIEDMRDIISCLSLKGAKAEHHKEALLELNNVGIGRLFRRLFTGRDSKRINPHTGKQSRCFYVGTPLWEDLMKEKKVIDAWEIDKDILENI